MRSSSRLLVGLAVVFCPACGTSSQANPRPSLPEAELARRALDDSLTAWRNSPELERTTSTIRPVMFVDQQRQPGQRLRQFIVLGEYQGAESFRRYLVKLELEQPNETIHAFYYVFGQGPIWVYRAEDFDMIMHMDQSMMAAPPSSAVLSVPKGESKADLGQQNQAPPSATVKAKHGPGASP